MQGTYREILSQKFWRSVRKKEALVFHSTALAIRSINSLLHGKNENIPNIHREFSNNFFKNYFTRN